MGSDGAEDVTIAINSSPNKFLGSQYNTSIFPSFGGGVLCAKASMLLQVWHVKVDCFKLPGYEFIVIFMSDCTDDCLMTVHWVVQSVPPALLVRFLREHRSEWADYGVDAYSAACLKASPYAVPCARPGGFPSSQVILPLAPTVENEEVMAKLISIIPEFLNLCIILLLKCLLLTLVQFLEVVRLEGHAYSPEDVALARDMFLLQVSVTDSCINVCIPRYGSSVRLSSQIFLLTQFPDKY